MKTKIAILVEKDLKGFKGTAHLYKCDPPLEKHTYVIVSGCDAMFSGPETLIFPANAKGKVLSWGDLNGSFRGSIDHNQALENAGYEVKGK